MLVLAGAGAGWRRRGKVVIVLEPGAGGNKLEEDEVLGLGLRWVFEPALLALDLGLGWYTKPKFVISQPIGLAHSMDVDLSLESSPRPMDVL